MRQRAIKVYVGFVVVLAMGTLAIQDWPILQGVPLEDWVGFVVLLFLGLMAESLTLPISVGKRDGSTSSIIFLPLLACILLFGAVPTVLFMGLAGVAG